MIHTYIHVEPDVEVVVEVEEEVLLELVEVVVAVEEEVLLEVDVGMLLVEATSDVVVVSGYE